MPNTYLTLATVAEVHATFDSAAWSAYARFTDRQDSPIYDKTGVRESEGELWVNAGEWSPTKGYLNEEWIKPAFVYMKHQCDGCSYPPDMCCLQRSRHYDYDSDYEVADYDYDDESEDDYDQALTMLHAWPIGVESRPIEL